MVQPCRGLPAAQVQAGGLPSASPPLRPAVDKRARLSSTRLPASTLKLQFRDDVAVNPNDTEESIWAFLCEAQLVGPDAAREQFLQVRSPPRGTHQLCCGSGCRLFQLLPFGVARLSAGCSGSTLVETAPPPPPPPGVTLQVGRDPRPVMRAAFECFRSGAAPDAILAAAGPDSQGHDAFYARLYVGLWHEAHGDAAAAQAAITEVGWGPPGRLGQDCLLGPASSHGATLHGAPPARRQGALLCLLTPAAPVALRPLHAGGAHTVCPPVGRLHGSAGGGALRAARLGCVTAPRCGF